MGDVDLTGSSFAAGSGTVMIGTCMGLGVDLSGNSAAIAAGGGPLSKRGFMGLRGIAGLGNFMSGEREPSGDNDSLRIGCDRDMRWAFCSSPSPILCCWVPPLEVVYREPLSPRPYARLWLRTLWPSLRNVTGRYGSCGSLCERESEWNDSREPCRPTGRM